MHSEPLQLVTEAEALRLATLAASEKNRETLRTRLRVFEHAGQRLYAVRQVEALREYVARLRAGN